MTTTPNISHHKGAVTETGSVRIFVISADLPRGLRATARHKELFA